MKIDILKMEDTQDGGAIISFEVDREVLHLAFEYWLNSVLQAKIDEAFIEAATRGVVDETWSTSEADQEEKEFKRAFKELADEDDWIDKSLADK